MKARLLGDAFLERISVAVFMEQPRIEVGELLLNDPRYRGSVSSRRFQWWTLPCRRMRWQWAGGR